MLMGFTIGHRFDTGAVIGLSSLSLGETAVGGDLVGILSVSNGNGSYTFSITSDPSSKFDIDGVDNTRLEVEALATFDYGSATSHLVTIEADNGVDPVLSRTFQIAILDETNPSITSANTASVDENVVLAHSLTATDDSAVTWSIVGGADAAQFEISGSTLRWAANDTQDFEVPLDADTNNAYVVQVRATDAFGNTADQTITVTVTDVDDVAPTITSNNTVSVAENATLSHSLTANETVTWSIVGGVDQAQFEIATSTLRWVSDGTQDYEAPADADADNAYVVIVRATDTASNTTDQTITVTVTDEAEGGTTTFINFLHVGAY